MEITCSSVPLGRLRLYMSVNGAWQFHATHAVVVHHRWNSCVKCVRFIRHSLRPHPINCEQKEKKKIHESNEVAERIAVHTQDIGVEEATAITLIIRHDTWASAYPTHEEDYPEMSRAPLKMKLKENNVIGSSVTVTPLMNFESAHIAHRVE